MEETKNLNRSVLYMIFTIVIAAAIFASCPASYHVVDNYFFVEQQQEQEWLREIGLPKEKQKYLWDLCQEHNLDYDLMLAIMYHESRFNHDARNTNTNGTHDTGYMQINSSNRKWISELAERPLDLFDPYDNILAGVLIYKSYQDYWEDKTKEDLLDQYALNSYNMGINGYKKAGLVSRGYDRKIRSTAEDYKKKSD